MPNAAAGMLEPAAPAQVVERVDEEPDPRRRGDRAGALGDVGARSAAPGSTRPRACHHARAAASGPAGAGAGRSRWADGEPRGVEHREARAPSRPRRESTTCTGTGDGLRGERAARTVPDSSPDRCTDTISRAPDAAARS